MDIQTLIETQDFSQHKIVLKQGEWLQETELDVQQTFYILNGTGTIKIFSKIEHIHCTSFIQIEPNTPYVITNTCPTLLSILLTQAR